MQEHFNWRIADLDDYIAENEGRPVADILIESEEKFRNLESFYLQEIVKEKFDLVSLGGGTACSEKNLKIIKDNYTSIYLKWNPTTLFNRLKDNRENRPLIANLEEENLLSFITEKLSQREIYYKQATIVFDGDHQTKEELLTMLSNYALRKG